MRKTKITYPVVKKVFPLIMYQECEWCGQLVVRENMFKVTDYKECRACGEYPFRDYYVCSNCASNEEEVKELIKKRRDEFITKMRNMNKSIDTWVKLFKYESERKKIKQFEI